eukprot:3939828-Rhodomonas_salina.1
MLLCALLSLPCGAFCMLLRAHQRVATWLSRYAATRSRAGTAKKKKGGVRTPALIGVRVHGCAAGCGVSWRRSRISW